MERASLLATRESRCARTRARACVLGDGRAGPRVCGLTRCVRGPRYGVLQLKEVKFKEGDEDKSFQMVQVRPRLAAALPRA